MPPCTGPVTWPPSPPSASPAGVWTEHGGTAPRLVALIGYPPGADPDDVTRRVMGSAEFSADMAGFDVTDIVDVQTTLLDPTSFSPVR